MSERSRAANLPGSAVVVSMRRPRTDAKAPRWMTTGWSGPNTGESRESIKIPSGWARRSSEHYPLVIFVRALDEVGA
jgi:hypothetical protein